MSSDPAIGSSAPLGATVRPGGINFSVYSKSASSVELLLFDREDDIMPARVIPLDPQKNRTYHYWHVLVPELEPGQLYGFRAFGEFKPEQGLRFDSSKVLLDPYGLAVAVPKAYSRARGHTPAMKSIVANPGTYDWEGDRPLHRPFAETVIYEMHIRGFTRHPSSGVAPEKAGTYAGLIEKIPYLVDLGITAVELMPIFQFAAANAPVDRVDYWGYSPVSFFAAHRAYSSRLGLLDPLDEFRDMVKALHRAGIEVILDVVFNHTAEDDATRGPTFCFRGLANEDYYLLEPNGANYVNYTGTGNTLNANHPIVRRMIVDSVRYWVAHMHVDGFRFDLASVLGRDQTGRPVPNPPVLLDIESDPVLAGTKIIAEPWDAGGLYQVGSFVGDAWQEWNGKFRDDVRRFIKSDKCTVSTVASRLLGSPDIYGHENREPEQSINFVTCHDGFTLNDLVSYGQKHNLDNGENNRDGMDDNLSWNCGVEGPTGDPAIESLRLRQIKNFMALTLIAVGTPMLLMGDEVRRTQRGNNNAYCQDNEISWFDWSLCDRNPGLGRFVKMMIAFRLRRDVAIQGTRLAEFTLNQLLSRARLTWHGIALNCPDWGDDSHSIAFTVESLLKTFTIHAMLSAYWEPLTFELPPADSHWRRWVDTSLAPPEDIHAWEHGPVVSQSKYTVGPRSLVFLVDTPLKRN